MLVSDAITLVDTLADEGASDTEIIGWINDALADIGREVKATYPEVTSASDTLPLENKWCRLLLVVYAAARNKQKEASQFEYRDLYGQYLSSLEDFAMRYVVPDQYKDTTTDVESDIFTTPPYGWGGSW
jgi:hypothetical protein